MNKKQPNNMMELSKNDEHNLYTILILRHKTIMHVTFCFTFNLEITNTLLIITSKKRIIIKAT